jgi:tetratricopeptide (TPR) repeat protein
MISFWGVFWVDVSNHSTAQNGFVAIAKLLGSSAETIKDSLQALASMAKRWLLILDNADDPGFDYATYFPTGNRGAVLMTSRILECRYYSTVGHEALGGLELEYSTQLLLKAARIPEESWPSHVLEAQNIVRLLGSHTLALIQAGAFIAAGYCRLGQYPERYQQQRKNLLEHHPRQEKSRYQDVYATFEASADVLKHSHDNSGKDATDLLAILSLLHSSHLPIQVFQDAWAGARLFSQYTALHDPHRPSRLTARFGVAWKKAKKRVSSWPNEVGQQDVLMKEHISRLPEFLCPQNDKWDDNRLLKAIALLVSLSLVTRHQSDQYDVLSMHPLAHAWAKDRLGKKHQEEVWISTACVLVLSRRMSALWEIYERMLRPHMQSFLPPNPQILLSFDSQQIMLPLLIGCGYILLIMREHHRNHSMLNVIYQELGITPWTPSNTHLPIWTLASRTNLALRNTELAIVLLEHVTEAEKTLLAEAHPERLISLYNLAFAYNDNGQFNKAVPLLEVVIELYQTKLPGQIHSAWLALAQYELARASNAVGRTDKGIGLLEDVVKEQENEASGVSRRRLLASQHALGTAYNTNKQTKEALALLEHVAKAYETMLEETDFDWQAVQYELARGYLRDEQVEKGLATIKRVVEIQKMGLERTNFTLLSSQYMLSSAYAANGQPKEGLELLEYVVQMYGTILHDMHPVRTHARFTLAISYIENGLREKALVPLRRVVEVYKATLEVTDPLRQESEAALAELQVDAV